MKFSRQGKVYAGLVVFALSVWLAPAGYAAQTIYLEATGAVQGEIKGDSQISSMDRADKIEVYELHHLIRNEGGKKAHEPVVFLKRIDRASPLLYTALDNSEPLELIFRFYRPSVDGSGAEEHHYSVHLTGARVSAIEPVTRNTLDPQAAQFPDLERLRVTYGQIMVTYQINGATATLTNGTPQ